MGDKKKIKGSRAGWKVPLMIRKSRLSGIHFLFGSIEFKDL